MTSPSVQPGEATTSTTDQARPVVDVVARVLDDDQLADAIDLDEESWFWPVGGEVASVGDVLRDLQSTRADARRLRDRLAAVEQERDEVRAEVQRLDESRQRFVERLRAVRAELPGVPLTGVAGAVAEFRDRAGAAEARLEAVKAELETMTEFSRLVAVSALKNAALSVAPQPEPAPDRSWVTFTDARGRTVPSSLPVEPAQLGPSSTLADLEHVATTTVAAIAAAYGCPPDHPVFLYHLAGKVAEEGGEALAAYGEASGWARKPGTWEHFDEELADTVISAFLAAVGNGRDLPEAIRVKHAKVMARGFKQPTQAAL